MEKLIEWCAGNSKVPARDYWDDQWANTLHKPLAVAGVGPVATRLKAAPDEEISVFTENEIHIVVTGGESQNTCALRVPSLMTRKYCLLFTATA